MKPSVYLETTIISYLAAWPSRDLVRAGHQRLTRDWWEARRHEYDLCISEAVVQELQEGDPGAAARRLVLVEGVRSILVTPENLQLAKRMAEAAGLPERASIDALHVTLAAAHGVGYLVTWNCKHIAGARFRPRIESACRGLGLTPPVIVTPLEMLEQ